MTDLRRRILREWANARGSVLVWFGYPMWLRRIVCGKRHDRVTLDDPSGTLRLLSLRLHRGADRRRLTSGPRPTRPCQRRSTRTATLTHGLADRI